MSFWSRRPHDARAKAWRSFAAELELEDASDLAGRLRDHLDLGPGEVAPVYALKRPGQPQIVLFDQRRERVGPAGSVSTLRSCVLLRAGRVRAAGGADEFVSMRITARLNPVLEAIEAGRTGSNRIASGNGGSFDDAVAVYARDEAGASRLLSPATCEVLVRLLGASQPAAGSEAGEIPATVARATAPPVVVVGAHDVLLTLEESEPVAFERLVDLTADMLGLYAALSAAASQAR